MKKFDNSFPENNKIQYHKVNLLHKVSGNNILKNIVKYILCGLAILGVFLFIIVFSLLYKLTGRQKILIPPVPKNAIITLDFNTSFSEKTNNGLLLNVNSSGITFFDVIKTLNIALLDKNVKAVVANINVTGLGLSQIQELRKNIQNLHKAGKKTYIFSSGMGNLGGGTDEYYLASAFDKIYMQPNSDLGLTGISIEIPFVKDILKKIGVETEFYTRYEYKNAVSSLTENTLTPYNKQQMEYLAQNIYKTISKDIATSRNIKPQDINKIINTAPLSATEALKNNLIDGITYYSDLIDEIKKEHKAETIKFSDYAANYTQKNNKLPTIAYLTIEGTIIEGLTDELNLANDLTVNQNTIINSIKTIAKDKYVKALIVRINSPGGSYTASQSIWHELQKLKKEKNIPIVVSMGDYAASGGYFVALAGDKIIAEPLTITGSIGVLGGKFVFSELYKKLGINWGNIQIGENAGISSPHHHFSSSEQKAFNKSLDNIYHDFTQKVSEARNIPLNKLDNIARGRIWLGKDAVNVGLVDRIGNIDTALIEAKKMAGIDATQKFSIKTYPKPKTFAEKLNIFLHQSPQISINQLANKIGLDIHDISVLQHLQHDCITTPFVIYK